jgi:autotransporter-associated beta strand protein
LTKFNPAQLTLSGANTYSGKTTIQQGTLTVSSYNSVSGGSASSSLGHPTTVANGTIALGSGSNTATNRYVGPGENTDRVIDLSGTTGTVAIENNGFGTLSFLSDLTASGNGAKTLVLRGTNTIAGIIARIVDSSGGATSVTKSDSGGWFLIGSNTFTGNLTLTGGRLSLANPVALGQGTFVIGGNGLFDNLTTSDLTVTNGITCSGGSPTYVGFTNSMTINGPALITGANRTITVSAKTLTLGSTLGDSGQNRNLTKSGAGTLVLQAGGSYGGNTTISSGGGVLMIGGSGQLGGGLYSGTIANSATFNYASSASQTLAGVISGSGALIQSGSGGLTLTATNTYTGATTVSAGTLALSANGSLSIGTGVNIATGATFDVSGLPSATYNFSGSSLTGSGTGTTPGVDAATIVGASGGIVNLGSKPISLTYTPTAFSGDSTHPALYISQGALSLNGNAFTISNATATPLGVGTYAIIQQANGNVTSAGVYTATVTGSGVTAGNSGYISVSGGAVNLVVAPTVSFSNLTPNQIIAYGTTPVALSGTVSGAGPVYPAIGETITVVIAGNAQTTTINDATGDFSLNYNSSTIPAGTNHITYSYSGNDTTMAGAVDSFSTLAVNPASSSLALASSLNPSTVGSNVTFAATVSSSAGTPTGNVVFLTNGIPLATSALAGGIASASTALLPIGTNVVTAQFATQGNFVGSTNSLNQVVKSGVVLSQTNVIVSITNNEDGTFTLNMIGTPQAAYYLQGAGGVASPIWTTLAGSTNNAAGNGSWSFTVSNSSPAYYRSVAINPAP